MTEKPTYKELEQRVKALEKEAEKRKQSEEAQKSEMDKLKALLDGLASTNIGVDIVSIDYEVLQQNQILTERFGNIVGKKCYKEYMAREEPCNFCPMTRSLRNKRLEKVELRASDGRDYELLSAPLTNPDGTVDRAIEVVIDITERKLTEEALRKSEERLKFVLEGSQLGFWDWNIETGVVERNERWAEMLGYSLKEIEFSVKQWTDLIHQDDRAAAWKSIQDHLDGRSPVHEIEYRMLCKDGKYKWILDRAKIVKFNSRGQPVRMSGTHTDFTEKKRAEAEREKLLNELQNALREIKKLSGMLPICASCKKIRDDKGYWNKIEEYIETHSDASFTHGLCPECRDKIYGGEGWYKKGDFDK